MLAPVYLASGVTVGFVVIQTAARYGSSTLGEISVALCRARFERGGDDS